MKKVFGIIFILLGIVFTPITAIAIFQFGNRVLKVINETSVDKFEDLFGGLLFLALVVFLTFSFYKLGYKWVKGQPKSE